MRRRYVGQKAMARDEEGYRTGQALHFFEDS